MSKTQEYWLLALLGMVVSILLLWLAWISPGIEGGMDSYNHYLISKNTWQHPELILDYWGKPIYNLLASPFAQFGIIGTVVFNIICLVSSALLVYLICSHLQLKYAWLGYLLTLLSPIFLDNTISSLTEPLSALLVTLSIYFVVKERLLAGALIAGFLPYARSEGFIIVGVIFIYFIVRKANWKIFTTLLAGSLFFNLLGWIFMGEPFWIITQNPYLNFELSGRNVCGNGTLFHYLWAGHYTFGLVTCILLVISSIAIFYALLRRKYIDFKIVLILMCFIAYFASHTIIWWLGMMGSCGYVRVMTVIAPLSGIIALYAIHILILWSEKFKFKQSNTIVAICVVFIALNAVYVPIRYYAYKYPLQVSEEQEEYLKLASWYKTKDFDDRTKLYLYPYFSIIANIDPYNQKEHLELWQSSLQFTKPGDILIWDSHFGPNECNLPLDTLINNQDWKKIHSIFPPHPIVTANNANFEIHVFEKTR